MATELYDALNMKQLYYGFQGSKYIAIMMIIVLIALMVYNINVIHTGKGLAFNRAMIALLICTLLTIGFHIGFKDLFENNLNEQSWKYVLDNKYVNQHKLTLDLYNKIYDFENYTVYLDLKDTLPKKIIGAINSI